MKFTYSLLFSIVKFTQLLVPSHGVHPSCRKHFEGFNLGNDYNLNSPPSTKFTLYDVHLLTQVDEVRK